MRALFVVSCALLVPACASSTATSPDGQGPTVVGGTWGAPRAVADAGERRSVECDAPTPTCRPLSRESWPLLSLSPAGLGLALWNRWDGSQFRLASARFSAGAWDASADLPAGARGAPEPQSYGEYALAGDRAGNGVAAWRADGPMLRASRFTASGWSSPEPIGTGAHPVPIQSDGTGGLVTWFQDNADALLWSRRDVSGWTPPAVVLDLPHSSPTVVENVVAGAPDGGAVIAWVVHDTSADGRTYSDEIWSRRYTPSRGWDAAQRVVRFDQAFVSALRVAAHANGAVVTYELVRATTPSGIPSEEVWSQDSARAAGGSDEWRQPQRVGGNEPGIKYVTHSELAADMRGNAVVAWVAGPDPFFGPFTIWAARFSTATRQWEPATELTDVPGFVRTTVRPSDLRVALSDAGNTVVAWRQDDERKGRTTLWASHFALGAGRDAPHLLAEADDIGGRAALSPPELGIDASGNALVVWAQPDGDRVRIWSARLVATTR